MLVVRAEQMNCFKKAALLSFEEEMLAHFSNFAPQMIKSIGIEQTRKIIRLGMDQAAKYGFTYRGPVRFYLEMMLLFGSAFDTDPQYPWVAEILIQQDSDTQMQRAEFLYEKALDYQQKVSGPDDMHALAALKRIASLVRHPLTIPAENYISSMLKEIMQIYPQKAAYIGESALEAIIRKAAAGAQRQQFLTVRGVMLVSLLMLTLGHGCGADPLYPWVNKILVGQDTVDPGIKLQSLEKQFLEWLEYRLNSV